MKHVLKSTVLCLFAVVTACSSPREEAVGTDCVPRVALDAYVQRTIDRKADIQASVLPEPGSTLFLGSSIIEEGPWAQLFPDESIVNWGISAETSDDLLGRLDAVIAARPSRIVLYSGGNDISRQGRSAAEAVDGVDAAIERLLRDLPETELYVTTLFPREPVHARAVVAFNDELKRRLDDRPVSIIDGYDLVLGSDGAINPAFSNDGIHLSSEAYRLWADRIAEVF